MIAETTAMQYSPEIAEKLKTVRFFPFIAPPNGGKGTQTQALVETFGFPRLDMGSLLRAIAKEDSPLGHAVKSRIDEGRLVETAIVLDVLQDGVVKSLQQKTSQNTDSEITGFILDGFPRNQEQTDGILSMCEKTGAQIATVFYLDVPTAVIVERAVNRRLCPNCGAIYNLASKPPQKEDVCDVCGHQGLQHRVDDHADKVQVRLEGYEAETRPILDVFESKGLITRLDGNRPPSEITQELTEKVRHYL